MQWGRKREAKKKDADATTVQAEPHPFKQNRAAEKQGKVTAALRHLHNKHSLLRGASKNPCRTSQQELF